MTGWGLSFCSGSWINLITETNRKTYMHASNLILSNSGLLQVRKGLGEMYSILYGQSANLQTMVLYNLLVACHVLNGLYDLYKMPLFFAAWDLNFFYSNSLGFVYFSEEGETSR